MLKSASAKSLLYLDLNKMEPGDIVFSLGGGWLSPYLASFGGGDYSHAAVFIGADHLLESLDDGVGLTNIRRQRTEIYDPPMNEFMKLPIEELDKRNRILTSLPDAKIACVKRHPGMKSRVQKYGRLKEDAFIGISKPTWFLEYPQATALADATWTNSFMKFLAREGLKILELYDDPTIIPGPFCSQLVVEVMNKFDLKLFDEELKPEHVSPSRIAASPYLTDVVGAVTTINPAAKLLRDDSDDSSANESRRARVRIGVQAKKLNALLDALRKHLDSFNEKLTRKNDEMQKDLDSMLDDGEDTPANVPRPADPPPGPGPRRVDHPGP